jgi:SpoU rRNA methylase family enzyme
MARIKPTTPEGTLADEAGRLPARLATTKANANAAQSVPELRKAVADLTEQVALLLAIIEQGR